jgi:hypothetical protein
MGRSSRFLIAAMALTAMPVGSASAGGPHRPGDHLGRAVGGRFFGRSYLGPSYFDGAYFGAPGGSIVPAVDGPAFGFAPQPCAPPPLVIEVGRGLAHPAKTRVTYGTPACAS